MEAQQALKRLIEGNARHVAGTSEVDAVRLRAGRESSLTRQNPFAIVLGCADSRVPVETVFDQGIGDLFVVRVAGNIATPSQTGSIEFAVAQFGTPLVVVLGHSSCGAVQATLQTVQSGNPIESGNLLSIVDAIRPAVAPLVDGLGPGAISAQLQQQAIRANIQASVNQLTRRSTLLADRVAQGQLMLIGAEYALTSGKVTFLS